MIKFLLQEDDWEELKFLLSISNRIRQATPGERGPLVANEPNIRYRASGYLEAIHNGYAYIFASLPAAREFLEEVDNMPAAYLELFIREKVQHANA